MGTDGSGFWHCGEREIMDLVRLSRVQESVAVQTLECCSCWGAQLKYTNLGKGRGTEAGLRGQGAKEAQLGQELHP